MDVKESAILGDSVANHWYYRAKASALKRELSGFNPTAILDVGAGSGYFSRVLLETTGAMSATCVDPAYSEDKDELSGDKPILFRRSLRRTNADLVLFMDVLEHVESDISLLQPYIAMTKPGTRFVISVPAFEFLWSDHDVFLGHYRRYTVNTLERAVENSGLELVCCYYYYGAVFPIAAAIRLCARIFLPKRREARSHLRRHGFLTNAFLTTLCAMERPFMRFNRLFGLTVFAVLIKR